MGAKHATSVGRKPSHGRTSYPQSPTLLHVPKTEGEPPQAAPWRFRTPRGAARLADAGSAGAAKYRPVRLTKQACGPLKRTPSTQNLYSEKKVHNRKHMVLKYKPIAGEEDELESPDLQTRTFGNIPNSARKEPGAANLFDSGSVRAPCQFDFGWKHTPQNVHRVFTFDEGKTVDEPRGRRDLGPFGESTAQVRVRTRLSAGTKDPHNRKTYGQLSQQLKSYQIIVSDPSQHPDLVLSEVVAVPQPGSEKRDRTKERRESGLEPSGAGSVSEPPVKKAYNSSSMISTTAGKSSRRGQPAKQPMDTSGIVNKVNPNNVSNVITQQRRKSSVLKPSESTRHSPENSVSVDPPRPKHEKKRNYVDFTNAFDITPTHAMESARALQPLAQSEAAAGAPGSKGKSMAQLQIPPRVGVRTPIGPSPRRIDPAVFKPRLVSSKSYVRLFRDNGSGSKLKKDEGQSVRLVLNEKYKKIHEEQRMLAMYAEKKKRLASDETSRAERKRYWAGVNGKFDVRRLNSWYATMSSQVALQGEPGKKNEEL